MEFKCLAPLLPSNSSGLTSFLNNQAFKDRFPNKEEPRAALRATPL